MPAVNMELMFQATKDAKADFNQVVYWSRLLTWKNQTLTPNLDTIYLFPCFNTKDVGPMVLEIPPAVEGPDTASITGSIDDAWQEALEDVGPAGADKGKGAKVLTPAARLQTEGARRLHPAAVADVHRLAFLRSNIKGGSDADVARAVAYGKRVKFYACPRPRVPPRQVRRRDRGPVRQHHSVRSALLRTLDRFVQREPWLERDKVMIDPLKTIGIEKGKPFSPDANAQQILKVRRARRPSYAAGGGHAN